jgi:hypothetical protein
MEWEVRGKDSKKAIHEQAKQSQFLRASTIVLVRKKNREWNDIESARELADYRKREWSGNDHQAGEPRMTE